MQDSFIRSSPIQKKNYRCVQSNRAIANQ
uniref:Uncharacterized protein n=1 Tax=Arundo donax TaxID=35708 RepID=A0A0A8YNU4_ARUDO